MTPSQVGRSGSLVAPTYWWYAAREQLFCTVFGHHVNPGTRILDVGSADGPSVRWLHDRGWRVASDVDLGALRAGGVGATAMQLPFRDGVFDVIAAFDVLEHLADPHGALSEFRRVLVPGGVVLLSVPAYAWAWSQLDDVAGHHRRYTRTRFVSEVEGSALEVERATYAFAAVFPFFLIDRLRARLTGSEPERPGSSRLPGLLGRVLLWLTRVDVAWLRRWDLPFGSSVLVVARATWGHERS